jgi:uncharacterized membrane protein YoaK (UPF0700 family)
MVAVRAHLPAPIRLIAGAEPATIRDLLLIALTLASGAADAVAFLGLGKVFSAFMTGNLVFLGLGTVGAGPPDVVRVVSALVAFGLGVFLAVQIVKPTKGSSIWPRRVSIALGVTALAQLAFLVGWLTTSAHPSTAAADLLVGASAFAFGTQSGAVMSLDVKGVFTTAATATVILLASDEAGWSRSKAERRRFAGVLVGLVAGAAAAAFLLLQARIYAAILPAALTVLVVLTARLALEPARDHVLLG